ncbi:MAG: GntR family transcriptional regulator [Thermomicrobiales bacterium]
MGATVVQSNNGPRYELVRQDLLARIRRGDYNPGDRLPSENQICAEYGVSVTTARRALQELVRDGVVFRQAGVGTMVAPRLRQMRLALVSIGYLGGSLRPSSAAIGDLIAGVGECAWERDAYFSMTGLHEDEATTHLRNVVRDRATDGVLLRIGGNVRAEYLDILEAGKMPYVVIKRHLPGREHNCVVPDDVMGGWLATKHLLDLGHRRIAFVSARPVLTSSQERLAGYQKALAQRGMAADESLIRADLPDFQPTTGYGEVMELLKGPNPPAALFVASDTLALGGYDAIRDAGLRIGADVAVVGYDDISTVERLTPPLTTVRISHFDFGRLSTELLIDLLDGQVFAPVRRVIPPALVVRESAGEGGPVRSEDVARGELLVDGRLARQTVAIAGADSPARRAIVDRIGAEGGQTIAASHVTTPPPPKTRTIVSVTDLGGAVSGFDELMATARAAAHHLEAHGGGHLLLVVALERSAGRGAIDRVAARAGVAAVIGAVAGDQSRPNVRVNAVLHTAGETDVERRLGHLAATVVFLASSEAQLVNGETISLH